MPTSDATIYAVWEPVEDGSTYIVEFVKVAADGSTTVAGAIELNGTAESVVNVLSDEDAALASYNDSVAGYELVVSNMLVDGKVLINGNSWVDMTSDDAQIKLPKT